MILDTLANARRYHALHHRFPEAFRFLSETDLPSLAQGRHDIAGDALFAIVSRANGRTRAEAPLECHRRYIDIQFIIAGTDEMGWKPARDCLHPRGEYSQEKDILFFDDAADSWVKTPAGGFCIFFPEDAHAPLVGTAPIHKLVVKVAV
ncbi:MAG: YhcH/YjgK/YiaL family protein [Gammaproteobacteria bacterium]|nr:YhcH/YjgK/YiaL family protein [Gammaproteobacteria bacterium]